ncbi:MAG TPA: hypothetical protein VN802_06925 [Stellaceae bacterium]|nr:hypothetical protein [Stellaceae bacterium]
MTTLLEKAFAQARKLPSKEQDTLGAIILDEITDADRWARTFAESQDKLAELADEALADLKAERTTPVKFPRRK